MRILLGIFCGLMVLFAGGCALLLAAGSGFGGMFQSLPLAAIPGGIAVLNVLVLLTLFGSRNPQRWAFHALAGIDAVAAVIVAVAWAGMGTGDSEVNTLAAVAIGILALKGALTVIAARSVAART
jgi:hypothetical protein